MKQKTTATLITFFILLLLFGKLVENRQRIRDKYYLRLYYKRAVSRFDMNPVTSQDVVFLGDSITEFFPLHEAFPNASIKNHGISGDTTRGVLRRLDQVTTGQPRQVFLLIGTNDLIFGIPKEQIVTNYEAILRQISQESPETQIFVLSILPQDPRFAVTISQLNLQFASLAEEYEFTFIDLFPHFVDEQGGLRMEFTGDGLHLTDNGYAKLKGTIKPFVYDDYYGGGGN